MPREPAWYLWRWQRSLLAEVDKGNIYGDVLPAGLIEWFQTTLENIELIRDGHIIVSSSIEQWSTYLSKEEIQRIIPHELPSTECNSRQVKVIQKGPLLKTEWGQTCGFNDLLPSKGCPGNCFTVNKPRTGCITTALAQVVRYHEHPATYDYASMPSSYGNKEIQHLMKDLAAALQTNLGCEASSAQFSSIVPVLKNSFQFSSAYFGSYGATSVHLIKGEVSAHRPVVLGGCASKKQFLWWTSYSNCHAWVCDGFREIVGSCSSTVFLHMNWGWNEEQTINNYNGWFAFDQWEVPGRKYQYLQEMVFNIRP
jgi:hypothetical protein